MADGSAIAHETRSGRAHAFNADAVALWQAQPSWTREELCEWLERQGHRPEAAAETAEQFLTQLHAVGLFLSEDDTAGVPSSG